MRNILYEGLSEDLGGYLEKGHMCDVKIHVGEYRDKKTFDAHSIILAARSPYFRKEIESRLQNSENVIEFYKPRISPSVFKPLLKYIYTGIVPLHNPEAENFLDVLLAADEPLLSDDPSLIIDFILVASELELGQLVERLQHNLLGDRTEWLRENIDRIYEKCFMNPSLKILKDFCIETIRTDVELMLQLEKFSRMPLNDAVLMMSRDDLMMEEIDVWNQAVRWSIAQFPNLSRNPERWTAVQCNDLKLMMENFTGVIRWLHISRDEFATSVVPYSKILTGELYGELVRYYLNSEASNFPNLPKRLGKFESNLISINHMSRISEWIEAQQARSIRRCERTTEKMRYRYNLLIRGSRDGFDKSNFQEACQNIGPTVTLIKPEGSDLIIGGYNPIPWTTSEENNIRTLKSFIFSFDNSCGDLANAGRLGGTKNSKVHPIISITNEGFKFGADFFLRFTNSYNQANFILDYHNVEYNLLDNVKLEIRNPVRIKDYEIFSIHDLPSSSQLTHFVIPSLQSSYNFILGISMRFIEFLLERNVLEKRNFDLFLKYSDLRTVFESLAAERRTDNTKESRKFK
ncbi:5392_t:CDS:2 [Acaulospora colombiana]|uniref:5392_t:CDS:1 n=1 Tax=Acaulospora colombiana TaxID=27376 RepID=A0ACA9K3Y0_9GLOM|nr:5392_t:CDS:2 [Acaulospora colombiana]